MQWTEERMQHAAGWAKAVQKGYRANKSTENQSCLKWHQRCGSRCKHSSPLHPSGCCRHQIWTQRKGFRSPQSNSKQRALIRSLGCIRGALLKSFSQLSSPTMLWLMVQVVVEHTNPFGNQRMYSRGAHGVPPSLTSPWATQTKPLPKGPWIHEVLSTVFWSHCTKGSWWHRHIPGWSCSTKASPEDNSPKQGCCLLCTALNRIFSLPFSFTAGCQAA